MDEVRILSPQGMLGYGYPEESFKRGMQRKPHAICVDAGSTDAGPHKLGAGVGIVSRDMTKRDLSIMIKGGYKAHIPILIGSAGGSGGHPHIEWTLDIIREIAKENDYKLKIAVINADVDKEWLKKQLKNGKVEPLEGVPQLDEKAINDAAEIVAQMGYEAYLPALEEGVDIIVGGRSYDPSMTTAVCVHYGMDVGLAYHMGKIIECGCQCAVPGASKDCILGTIHKNDFILEPMNPMRKCHDYTVAAHTLYEKTHPYLLPGPGGITDLSECTFTEISDGVVKVTGSKFHRNEKYIVKLEGARKTGYRTIFIAGMRDPIGISCINEIIEDTKKTVAELLPETTDKSKYFCDYKVYGINGCMGKDEPNPVADGHEICVVGEFVGPTQEKAAAFCSIARASIMHYHYKGRLSTGGNFALPFAPSDFNGGACYEFCVYHLVEIDDPTDFFKTKYITIG